ncbi:MAG: ferredoxin--NADP reductase [Burkholderiales bacterium]|jgi:ferredoxin--NADP+ reductase|nr:ferredoxin--NADP reductase [Burkholderiales bacterium]
MNQQTNTAAHWIEAQIVGKRQWTENLFTLQIDAPQIHFSAGQFASLALPSLPEENNTESMTARPYSFLNPPDVAPHEFLIARIADGALTPRLARLEVGDTIGIGNAYGFFGCDEPPPAENLWMIAGGAGIAPYLSLLRTVAPWQKFGHIVLVHGVRYANELVYRDVIASINAAHHGTFTYLPLVSRERNSFADDIAAIVTAGRITVALQSGVLERKAGKTMEAHNAQVMLCGNQSMIEEIQAFLKERGMRRHRRRMPGQITVESYLQSGVAGGADFGAAARSFNVA